MNAVTSAWIELRNVSKRYGQQPVLDGCLPDVERGPMRRRHGTQRLGQVDAAAPHRRARSRRRRRRPRRRHRSHAADGNASARGGGGRASASCSSPSISIPTLTVAENVELPLALNDVAPGRRAAAQPRAARRARARELRGPISRGHFRRRATTRRDCARRHSRAEARAWPTSRPATSMQRRRTTCSSCCGARAGERNATLIVATHSAEVAARAGARRDDSRRPHRGRGTVTRLLRRASLRFYLRHPWQLGLAIAGISLGVGVYVGVSLANDSAARAFDVAAARGARRGHASPAPARRQSRRALVSRPRLARRRSAGRARRRRRGRHRGSSRSARAAARHRSATRRRRAARGASRRPPVRTETSRA